MMKKVHLIYRGGVNIPTGVATVLRYFVENKAYFEEKGFDFSFFFKDTYKEKLTGKKNKGTRLTALKDMVKQTLQSFFISHRISTPFLMKYLFDRNAKKVIKEYLKQIKEVDIVFFHDITTAYYFYKYANFKSVKSIIVLHTDGSATSMLYNRFLKLEGSKYDKKLVIRFFNTLKKIDKIVFVSEKSKDNFVNNYKELVDVDKIEVVRNGVKDFSLPVIRKTKLNERIKLINVSSISKRKGQDILIEAYSKLSYIEKEKIEIDFVGTGEMEDWLKGKISELELCNLKTLGIRYDVPELLANSDLFILPSREEGLPMAIIEAMRAGLPIIATKVGGVQELVDQENGILINPNSDELTLIFKNLVDGTYDLEYMGVKSRKKFEEYFTVEKMIDNYISVLNLLKNA